MYFGIGEKTIIEDMKTSRVSLTKRQKIKYVFLKEILNRQFLPCSHIQIMKKVNVDRCCTDQVSVVFFV